MALGVSKSPGSKRQERKDAVSGHEDGRHQKDNCAGEMAVQGTKTKHSTDTHNICAGKRQWCLVRLLAD